MNRRVFADRLLSLIREKGVSQNTAAADMGIEQSSLSSYISCRKEPRATALVLMARYFEVSTDYLLGLTDRRKYV